MFLTSILKDANNGNSTPSDYKGELIKAFISGLGYFDELTDVDVLIWHVGDRSVRENAYLALSKAFMENDIQNGYEEQYISLPNDYDSPKNIEKCLSRGYEIVCSTQDQKKKQQFICQQIIGPKEPNGVEHAKEPDDKTHNKLQKQNYGYLSISHNMDLNNSEQQNLELRVKILANDYAQYLLDSRYFRKIETSKFIHNLSTTPIDFNEDNYAGENVILKLVRFLKLQLSMENVQIITFQKNAHALDLDYLRMKEIPQTTLSEVNTQIDLENNLINYSHLTNGPIRKNHFHSNNETQLTRDKTYNNILIIPLNEPSLEFEDTNFCFYEKFPRKPSAEGIVNIALVFSIKKRKNSISQTISETDIEVAKTAGQQFASWFSSYMNELKQANFPEKLRAEMPSFEVPSAKTIYHLVSQFFECKSVTRFRSDPHESQNQFSIDEYKSSNKYSIDDKISRIYQENLIQQLNIEEKLSGIISSRSKFGFDESPKDITKNKAFRIEVAFTTHNNKFFILAFEISDKKISEVDFRLFYFLTAELILLFKQQEDEERRSRSLAQRNHLLHTPLTKVSKQLNTLNELHDIYHERYNKNDGNKDHAENFLLHPIWELKEDYYNSLHLLSNLLASSKSLFMKDTHAAPKLIADNIISIFNRAKRDTLEVHKKISPQKRILIPLLAGNLSDIQIIGDKSLLYSAFCNLLDNAIKFTIEKHSAAYFYERLHREPSIRKDIMNFDKVILTSFSQIPNQNLVKFEIQSVGMHLTTEEISRIRYPGERGVHAYGVFKVSGTGIGLPLIEKILNLHSPKARLSIQSQPLMNFSGNTALNSFAFNLPRIVKGKN